MLQVWSPVAGRSLAVSDLPDPVFSKGLVGPGRAIRPFSGKQCALAPVSGTLVKLHPHAFVILTDGGHGVLVHLGVDTVRMQGAGFELHAGENDEVTAGDEIVTWNPADVEKAGYSPLCAVVVLDCTPDVIEHHTGNGQVEAKQLLFEVDVDVT